MENIHFRKNIVFGKMEQEYLTADIFKPKIHTDDYLPVIVLIHGGGFQSGSKEMNTEWGMNLAKEGYFVIAINYRLSNAGSPTYPKVFDDIREAMNWLVLNANKWRLDLERIGLIGDSAGAYLASAFALKNNAHSYRICSVIGVYGIYDLVDECLNPINNREDNIYERFLGMPFKGNQQAFHEASPVFYLNDAVNKPTFDVKFFLTWGGQDTVVKPSQSRDFAEKLRKASVHVETEEIKEKGHYWFNKLPNIEGGGITDYPNVMLYPKLIDFLNRTIREVPSGNFSSRQIQMLSKLENLALIN